MPDKSRRAALARARRAKLKSENANKYAQAQVKEKERQLKRKQNMTKAQREQDVNKRREACRRYYQEKKNKKCATTPHSSEPSSSSSYRSRNTTLSPFKSANSLGKAVARAKKQHVLPRSPRKKCKVSLDVCSTIYRYNILVCYISDRLFYRFRLLVISRSFVS